MPTYFNPGCALSIDRPDAGQMILDWLNRYCFEQFGVIAMHRTCCRHDPQLAGGSRIINVCAGCDRRFSSLYEGISTISLWEVIDGISDFTFPDYQGKQMSVHDACPVREKPQVHQAVRSLLSKMNIEVIETDNRGTRSKCCGDDFYPTWPVEHVHEKMLERASEMPCEDVVVYCVSCIKAMHIGGRTPRHLVDLLTGRDTSPEISDTVAWHKQLQTYIDKH